MKNSNFLLILSFIFITLTICTSCGKDENCLTCTLAGETDDICESNLDEFNRDSGLNAGTVGEVATIIQLLGGSCR